MLPLSVHIGNNYNEVQCIRLVTLSGVRSLEETVLHPQHAAHARTLHPAGLRGFVKLHSAPVPALS